MRELQTKIPRSKVIRDRYMLEELLGQGGFGAVYRVRDRRVKGNVFALKEINNANRYQRESFIFEGELLKRLDHPALPRVYRVFEESKSDRMCMLMDYIEGPNLERLRLRQPEKRFSLAQILHMLAPIYNALLYLHEQQPPIIHRDIKPSNIIIPPSGEDAVLVDFGIAKEYEQDSTTTAIRHCSPGYGAPEQYVSGTSTRTDVYGLGATIYTLLTGMVPIDALYRITRLSVKRDDPLQRANDLVATIPESVADALERAMAINSADRFSSVQEFWQTLQAALSTESPSTDPVAYVRSLTSSHTEQDMAAALASVPVSDQRGMRMPPTPAETPAPVTPLVTPVTPLLVLKQGDDASLSSSTEETLPHTQAVEAGPRREKHSRREAFGVLLLAALLLIGASSLGAYVYAGAQQSSALLASSHPAATTPATRDLLLTPQATVKGSTKKKDTGKDVLVPSSAVRQGQSQLTGSSQLLPTPIPTVVQATATPVVTPTPVSDSLPVLVSIYNGTIHNTPAQVNTWLALSQIQQTQGAITGYLSMGPRLIGQGNFSGNVTAEKGISFLVTNSGGVLPLFFTGSIHTDGSMSGNYCSYRNNQCDRSGGYGTWSVVPW